LEAIQEVFSEGVSFKHYYDKKMQEFFELRLGSMTMGEYEKNFLGLLKYVGFIKDEKVKIQRFFSGIPSFYKDKIQYDEPRTLT
jgi:hypothetical protein